VPATIARARSDVRSPVVSSRRSPVVLDRCQSGARVDLALAPLDAVYSA
jgi:hypothetical protein